MQLADGAFDPVEFNGAIKVIDDLTAFEALPVQSPGGEAIDRRAIMLAAWLSVLDGGDDTASLASAPSDHESQAFFAKAIEMSALLAGWKGVS